MRLHLKHNGQALLSFRIATGKKVVVVVEWGTVIAILVPVAGLVASVFRVLDGRLTRIDRRAEDRFKEFERRAEERYQDLVTLIRGYHPSVPSHSDPGVAR